MKSVGALSNRRWRLQLMIAALAATPIILSGDCAFSQTTDSTESSRMWKSAAAAASIGPASAKRLPPAPGSLPTNLVADEGTPPLALPLAPPPRHESAYDDDDVIAPPRDTSAPIENDPTAMP